MCENTQDQINVNKIGLMCGIGCVFLLSWREPGPLYGISEQCKSISGFVSSRFKPWVQVFGVDV